MRVACYDACGGDERVVVEHHQTVIQVVLVVLGHVKALAVVVDETVVDEERAVAV